MGLKAKASRASARAAILLAFVAGVVWLADARPFVGPETALQNFYRWQGPECTLTAPLHWSGRRVVPLVIREIQDRAMPRRRYGIGFLGQVRDRRALPALEAILLDTTERDYFRGDALLSIAAIDAAHARRLVTSIPDPSGYLRQAIRYVLEDHEVLRVMFDRSC